MPASHLGVVAALGAALAWAAGAVLFKRPADRMLPLGLATLKGLLGLALLVPLWWWLGPSAISGSDALWLGASGVVGIAIGDACFFAALGLLPAHVVVLLSLGGQALVVLLAVLLLGERLTILVGMDDCILEGIAAGARGWIAGLVNAFPKESVDVFNYAQNGEVAKAFGVPVEVGVKVAKVKTSDGQEISLTRSATAKRWTFIIGKDGKIAYKNTMVAAAEDSKTIAEAVAKLKK